MIKNSSRGFTLIEVIIYLALFSIFIGGAVATSYSMVESSSRNQTRATLEEEGDFLIGKIEWALSSIQAVNTPVTTGGILSVNKWDVGIGTIVIDLDPVTHTDIRLARGANPPQLLNSSRVQVSNLLFTHTYSNTANPESVAARFTLSATTDNGVVISQDFSTTKYLRR